MQKTKECYGNVPMNEPFEYKGKIYKPIKAENDELCAICDLCTECFTNGNVDISFACIGFARDDHNECIFKLVENYKKK